MAHVTMAARNGTTRDDNYNDRSIPRKGLRGVRLKKFEEAMADLLPQVTPHFCCLPRLPDSDAWPCLPPEAQVTGDGPGKLKGTRALRKEGQMRSMLRCVMAMLPERRSGDSEVVQQSPVTIVDFCGGTGHLALPLALLLPDCKVIVVDLNARSLQLLHEKAMRCGSPDFGSDSTLDGAVHQQKSNVTYQEQIERQCVGIPNLYTFQGSIETYTQHFDIGVALHACGEASDVTLRACGRVGANFCVSPCCVGKLHRQRRNPYIYHATADNVPTISYPQSTSFADCLLRDDLWDVLVQAADYSDLMEVRTPRNATRRTAKALLETDRLLFMKERYGYQTALTRMDPWESSPKNDILLGWFDDASQQVQSPYQNGDMQPDEECNADIQCSIQHLLQGEAHSPNYYCQPTSLDGVDWTWQEEQDMRALLEEFVESDKRKWILPTGMGSRKRKLVHCVAEQMGLAHWCHGQKYAEKTVVVAKRTGHTVGCE